jgi:serine/threonine protein kinase
MPVPTTNTELLELLHKSELVPTARLESFFSEQQGNLPASPREMVKALIQTGLITQFQGDQLLQGKWRGFTLGKYRVLERIGSGGMGTVYLCEHAMVGRKVAVKVLPTSQSNNPAALGRFYREARAAGVLDHPNLVRAHDIDQEGGLHFLVMDYVDGSSLQAIVSKHGPFSVPRAIEYVRQAAVGLAHAHASGLIHRDIKPANIMLERNGTIRVLDLGLARFFNDHTDMLTVKYDDKHVLGTADYVAPEQALNSHDVDIRADIYSLGCTLYFCLTGHPPFPEGKVAQKLIWHQVREPAPITQIRPEVPEALASVLGKMMAKEVEQRYQTPGEVADALAALVECPIDLPPAEEMPRLCPAALAAGNNNSTRQVAERASAARVIPTRPSDQGRVVMTQEREPSAAEMATPRSLGLAPTRTDDPRPTPTAVPVATLVPPPAVSEVSNPSTIVLLIVLTLLGAALGVLVSLWR